MKKIILTSIYLFASSLLVFGQTASISGTILHTSNTPMADVVVRVFDTLDQQVAEVVTDANGQYTVTDLSVGELYTINPKKDDNPLNGLSTFDMVLGARHILGIQLLDEPYKYLAMDVNNSQSLTTFDLVVKRRLILFINQEFPDDIPSWRFYRADYVFDPSDPFEDVDEIFSRSVLLSEDVEGMDFFGFKMGDLNESAVP